MISRICKNKNNNNGLIERKKSNFIIKNFYRLLQSKHYKLCFAVWAQIRFLQLHIVCETCLTNLREWANKIRNCRLEYQ